MKRIILNVLVLSLLALPCYFVFNEPNPFTGEWDYQCNIFGLVYSCWYFKAILKPTFEPFIDKL